MTATLADALGRHVEELQDFRDGFTSLEKRVAKSFLKSQTKVDEEALRGQLRYADLLSHSSVPGHRDLAYSIVAMAQELLSMTELGGPTSDRVMAVTEAVLVQLGNFPGLKTLGKLGQSERALPLTREIARIGRETLQVTRRGDGVLTNAQFQIAERLRGSDYFSFSGPTSLGKSFILKDLIFEIANRPELVNRAVVMLVPTKALIGQTAADLRAALVDVADVNVATFPVLPRYLARRYRKSIFVLTPERLLKYLVNPVREVDYLIVDEAQKLIAENDTRSSLYYHAITETARRFATKLVFSSPSIANPELFLELFEKSTHGSIAVKERTVSQQRYFVDLVSGTADYISLLDAGSRRLKGVDLPADPIVAIRRLSRGRQSLVYVNGSVPASDLAVQLTAGRKRIDDPRVDDLVKFIREYVHPDYFLAKCLKRGVAYHHGKMPQEIRERVEDLYAQPDSPIRVVVCTSTLLEGVNMPAKTIFVLSDKHGPRNFSSIDFENLVGRAGRLTYDFSGRVVVLRADPRRWAGTTKELIARSEPQVAESFLVNPGRRKKEFTDIARVLRGQSLPGNPSADQVRSVQQYASILLLQHRESQATPLTSLFIDKVDGARDLLRRSSAGADVPLDALRASPDILPARQERVWRFLMSTPEPALISPDADLSDVEIYRNALRRLSVLYDWPQAESAGRDPLVPGQAGANVDGRLWYWSLLMRSWVRGDPLSRLIKESIRHHERQGVIKYWDYTDEARLIEERFDRKLPRHVNRVIEKAFSDLEGGLRFRIISYLQNYRALSVRAVGEDTAGLDLATLVEYGSIDPRSIQLQEIGLSRSVASALLLDASHLLDFSDVGELLDLDLNGISSSQKLSADVKAEVLAVVR